MTTEDWHSGELEGTTDEGRAVLSRKSAGKKEAPKCDAVAETRSDGELPSTSMDAAGNCVLAELAIAPDTSGAR